MFVYKTTHYAEKKMAAIATHMSGESMNKIEHRLIYIIGVSSQAVENESHEGLRQRAREILKDTAARGKLFRPE